MSEIYYSGDVFFDRELTEEEKDEIEDIFCKKSSNYYVASVLFEDPTEFPDFPENTKSFMNFEEYCTGWSGLNAELGALSKYCKEKGIGIIPTKSFIRYYGDEDGCLCYTETDGRFVDFSSTGLGVFDCSTPSIVYILQIQKRVEDLLRYIPTNYLEEELAKRKQTEK